MSSQDAIIIGWIITGIIAIIGWIFGAIQATRNRNMQKTLEQKKMRHDAYALFLREIDDISKEMSYSPMNTIRDIAQKYISKVLEINYQAEDNEAILNECINEMYNEMWACIEHASIPLMRISQVVAAVELDASAELIPMLQELKALTLEFNQEWQRALGSFSKDQEGLQKLTEIGKNNKWQQFVDLKSQIIQQMRKECAIE